ncbi:MAG: hypothetical protein Solumvirus4_9 [Solumvirus sp.]|uniref:Uncharacterized protein n=1 Tax=Solumvirus sp. TaxID=2487773 RepID=A0A3G5AJ24_9VIRU|nr:MAG: hypothetical protein Solumvirus4_9 [Solumvirus sp.]
MGQILLDNIYIYIYIYIKIHDYIIMILLHTISSNTITPKQTPPQSTSL